jgi:flagellar export protein FliJ
MKPFSLLTVLKHRKILEDQAIHRLVQAQEAEQNAQRQLNDNEEILTNLIETLAREQINGIEVMKHAQFEQRILLLEKQRLTLQTILRGKKEEVSRAQKHLVSRSKDRKIMETLQTKQNEAWQLYQHQKETATLDEIAVLFHNRE